MRRDTHARSVKPRRARFDRMAAPLAAPKYFSLFAKPAPKPSTSESSEPAAAVTPSTPPPAQPDAPTPVLSLSSDSPGRQSLTPQPSPATSRRCDGGRVATPSEHALVELDLDNVDGSEDMDFETATPALVRPFTAARREEGELTRLNGLL